MFKTKQLNSQKLKNVKFEKNEKTIKFEQIQCKNFPFKFFKNSACFAHTLS